MFMDESKRIVFLLILFLCITGCMQTAPIVKPSTVISTSDGLLSLSLTLENRKSGWFSNDRMQAWFYYRRYGSNEEVRLRSHSYTPFGSKDEIEGDENKSGRLLLLSLAEGKYELINWELVVPSGTASKYIYPKNPKPIPFVVTPGEILYIGSLNLNVLYGENIFGIEIPAGAIASASDESERDIKLLHAKYPKFSAWPVSVKIPDLSPLTSESE